MADGDDGGVVVKCHAGCTFEAICSAAGVHPLELAPERSTPDREREIRAVYDYVDEDYGLLFQAVRFSPKGFAQRRSETDWSIKGVRRVPYRLPRVIEAAQLGTAVWICEGEKDADALGELGFTATCNPMGAGKWEDEYVDYFKGAPWILIVPDCDVAGRKHASEIAASFHARGANVKVVDLGRDDGYDASDFIAEHDGQAAHKLRELAQTTPRWTGREPRRTALPVQDASTFLANVPPYDESKDYLGSLLHGGYRIHVAGPIGHGKTSLILEAVSAAVRGEDFLGFTGKGNVRARLVDLEMPAELLGQAIRDARLKDTDGFDIIHLPNGLRIDTHPEDRQLLEHAAEGVDILAIDPFYKLMEQEMEYSATRAINACLDGIRHRHPNLCTLVGFHAQEPHTPKEQLLMSSISGFKVFQRPADIVLTFQRVEGDTSRIRWLKNRSPRLRVKHGEFWTVEWDRGAGFRRIDDSQATLRDTEGDEDAEFTRLFG